MKTNSAQNTAAQDHPDTPAVSSAVAARLRQLPSVSRLMAQTSLRALEGIVPPALVTESTRVVLEQTRQAIRVGMENAPDLSSIEAELAAQIVQEALRRHVPSLQGAVNATGIVLHTGLGRARLANAAREALLEVALGHANVEIDRETGRRGERRDHVRGLLCELTGAEDATVVNNCAGAVFLAVNALAAGREVIISRGELVEIGGAFRMPDIVRSSGAALVEVGTTNRTRLSDYASAITERTGLILRCSPSNFTILGFTESASLSELAALGRERGILVLDDQGSGAMLNAEGHGLSELSTGKGTLRDSIQAGSDIVMASSDKLLGGPQAGLILGRREYIERIVRHPLARALRVDKFTLAALEATLRLYRDPEQARQQIPTLRYLARTEAELRRMAQKLKAKLRAVLPADRFALDFVAERSQVGGGALPGEDLPTVCVRLRVMDDTLNVDEAARILRLHTPAVFARIKANALLFDPRALEPEELSLIAEAVKKLNPQ